jgi:Protein of unknown function (DUF1559)
LALNSVFSVGDLSRSDCHEHFPSGATDAPARASVLALLLPHLEEGNRYRLFDFSKDVTFDPANAAARAQDVKVFLCPSDPSAGRMADPFGSFFGRSNYHANLGTHALWSNTDGTSATALFAEVLRGFPGQGPRVFGELDKPLWEAVPAHDTNAAVCNWPGYIYMYWLDRYERIGLQFQRAAMWTTFYNHTAPPNTPIQDCLIAPTLDRGHFAARSEHRGGLNLCLADGSVHFIRDSINPTVWRAIGTRGAGEAIQLQP